MFLTKVSYVSAIPLVSKIFRPRSVLIDKNRLDYFNNKANMTTTDPIEIGKSAAAFKAVDDNIKSNCIVGIGSGSTMTYVLERILHTCKQRNITVKCIPTSYQSKQLVHDFGLQLTELACDPVIDVTIDGADEVDRNLVAIKGGGACLAQEKVVAAAARKFVVVADYRKNSRYLGEKWRRGIPVEVLPMACEVVRRRISQYMGIKMDEVKVRQGKEKAGPVVTDNGNFVIDFNFDIKKTEAFTAEDWNNLSNEIILMPGVVDVGIFAGLVSEAYFGESDGNVSVLKKSS